MKFVADLLSFKKSTKTLLFALFCLATLTLASEIQKTSTEEIKSELKDNSFMKKTERKKEILELGQLCHKDEEEKCKTGLDCKKKFPDFTTSK